MFAAILLGLLALCVADVEAAASPATDVRPFEVADSVAMRKLALGFGTTFQFSPSGEHFFFLVHGGDLDSGLQRSELAIYGAADVLKAIRENAPPPKPRRSVAFHSSSNRHALSDPQWSADSRFVYFRGEALNEMPQLYRLEVKTGGVARLTSEANGIWGYGAAANGIVASVWKKRDFGAAGGNQPFVMRNDGLPNIFGIDFWDPDSYAEYSTYAWGRDGRRRLVDESFRSLRQSVDYSVSPDGRYAITSRTARRVPLHWERYGGASPAHPLKATENPADISLIFTEFVLIDLQSGTVAPLIDAPTGHATGYFPGGPPHAVWRADSRSVILINALQPLSRNPADALPPRHADAAILDVEIPSGRAALVGFLFEEGTKRERVNIEDYRWDEREQKLSLFRFAGDAQRPTAVFKKQGGTWRTTTEPAGESHIVTASSGKLQVRWLESLEAPSVVLAKDLDSGKEIVLLDPNPHLKLRTLSPTRVMRWTDANGNEWKAGLLLPIGYKPGTRYPFVLQTHGFYDKRLMIDGPGSAPPPFAAQALANKGFVVLQMEDRLDLQGGPDEAQIYMAAYESAIAKLVAEGLIDESRMGIAGFSRTCFHVKFAVVHSKYRFKAGITADGVDYGYFQYVMSYKYFEGIDSDPGFLVLYGGAQPVGEGLTKWTPFAAGFNLDKVETAMLLGAYGRGSVLSEWEWYAGLKRLKKPVELVVVPNGVHVLAKPRERYFVQQAAVDWFRFWLKGEVDADESKREQYERWRAMQPPKGS